MTNGRARHRLAAAITIALVAIGTACSTSTTVAEPKLDLHRARTFDRYPIYWVGHRFENWNLEQVLIGPDFVTLIYGTCEIDDPDGPFGAEGGSCSAPLQIQIQPLCAHLAAVARAPIWRQRQIRGAPVGTIDSAPVMFTNRVQIKVYRGQGSDAGVPMRALRALRSLNDVPPVIGSDEPMPAAPRAVLSGTRLCRP